MEHPDIWCDDMTTAYTPVAEVSLGRPGGTMRTFYEEFRVYYLPWTVAAAAIAIILWQQHTTMALIERINDSYLARLATVSESLERINTTLHTAGYTIPPLETARETGVQASR
jgi:hypothetical protein